jgi:Domain of unknown function (DU1801)
VVTSSAATPEEYVASLPEDRREIVSAIRDVINRNLPDGYAEGMTSGMIGWYVPLERFPDTYNGQPLGLAGLASQKQYVSLYLISVYGDRATEAVFRERWAASGKPLNMGKSCVRIRRLDEVPLDVVGETIARADLDTFLAFHEEARGSSRTTRARSS